VATEQYPDRTLENAGRRKRERVEHRPKPKPCNHIKKGLKS
jgi:hypothetical protein